MNNIKVNTKDRIVDIVKDILKTETVDDDSLYLIVTESRLAINFVTMIEDEFDIEIDDDDIDVEFFNSIDEIASRLEKYIIDL